MRESADAAQPAAEGIDFAWHSDVGLRRSNNEDAARCDLLSDNSGGLSTLLVLSDGVGGANAGEVASRMAVDGIHEILEAVWRERTPVAEFDPTLGLTDAILTVDRRIREITALPRGQSMAATLCTVWVVAETAHWGQAGDSRIYLYRQGVLKQITEDHSPVGRLRAQGALTEADARGPPGRSITDQCLGGTEVVVPSFGSIVLEENDVFLICWDGLVDGLWDHDLAKWLGVVDGKVDLGALVREMIEAAKKASGKDNITAILARVTRVEAPRPLGGLLAWLDGP